ncbi:uncharacterized protein LOC101854564 [Aplysia californica]|uniref:Uncharacterized protein LOC101854564 n=1 Tax=Aplysia californica TaxID=6500 RepID=A0ABM0JLN5_APLCA|nr:uncharacterized protein LOC101854564 [Aplysia californica]
MLCSHYHVRPLFERCLISLRRCGGRAVHASKSADCPKGNNSRIMKTADTNSLLPNLSNFRHCGSRHSHSLSAHITTNLVREFHGSFSLNSSSLSPNDLKKAMQSLTDQFMEARELLDDARESMGTVYFSDDMSDAQAAVSDTLVEYKQLLSQLSADQRQEVLKTIGLRMEELKAQEQAIKEALHDDH